jgi:dolichyl-phosphate-mannose-protein mannosyltransferase
VPMPDDTAISWLCTVAVALIAGVFRFWSLGFPSEKVFDELYYSTEGQEMLRQGYENNPGYMFIVHPPLGKWLVASGEALGQWAGWAPSFAWRFPSALAGTLTVLILVRVVRRMTRSTLLGTIAGLLLALDALSVVQSRFALLDIFLPLLLVAGFGCLVVDRDKVRARLAAAVEAGQIGAMGAGPGLGMRPWRLVGGVLLGLSCAVKWSGVFFLIGFALLSVLWDVGARQSAGVRRPWLASGLRDLPNGVLALVVAPIAAYLATWAGWFLGENSYGRHWAGSPSDPGEYWSWLPGPIRSLVHYHWEMYHFHDKLTSYHPYSSSPWSWLVTGRPVLYYYPTNLTGCGAPSCARSVLEVGTPALWWAFVPAICWMVWLLVSRRDWRAGAVLMAFAAGWLTWLRLPERTMFLFYMAPLVPFLVIGVTLALGSLLGRARADETRRLYGQLAVCGYVALVAINFIWLWPVLNAQLISHAAWHARMWFPSWI